MRLTLGQLEDIYLRSEDLSPISPATWSLLYFSARNDGIDKIDALCVLKGEPSDVGLFIEAFLSLQDIEEVRKLSFTIGLEMPTPHSDVAVTKRMLDAWIAKTLMLEIIQASDRRSSQIDDVA